MDTERDIFQYQVDESDRVAQWDAKFIGFALENDFDVGKLRTLLGTSLWSHFADRNTIELHSWLFGAARSSGIAIKLRSRCDSPESFRLICLTVEPSRGGWIEVSSETLEERPLLPTDTAPEGSLPVSVCGWCRRIHSESGWAELGEFILPMEHEPELSHGMCPDCFSSVDQAVTHAE